MMQNRLENLLSLICKRVFLLIPVLFAVAHVAADGETSNYIAGCKFDPLYDHISTYASRSPAGWAIVVCILGFAYVLGFVSWHAARRGPGFLAWITSVIAAIAMFQMLDMAWYPMKPNREAFERIQEEVINAPVEKKIDAEIRVASNIAGFDHGWILESSEYLRSIRSYWLHTHAGTSAQKLILLTMMGAALLWRRRVNGPDFWLCANFVAVIWIGAGGIGAQQHPCYIGLFQRIIYIGFYFWMWIVVREIERQKIPVGRMSEADESGESDGSRSKVRAP